MPHQLNLLDRPAPQPDVWDRLNDAQRTIVIDTTFAGLLVSGTSLHENGANGLSILGTDANTTSPTGVQVVNSTFLNNGSAASAGDGDVSFFRFNGDAGLKDVTITADAQFPIQFRGKGTASPGSSSEREAANTIRRSRMKMWRMTLC